MAFTLHHPRIEDREWRAMSASQQGRANLAQIIDPHKICTEPDACKCKCEACESAKVQLAALRKDWNT